MNGLRRYTWVAGLLGAAFALGFVVRTALRGVVDERGWAFALAGAVLLLAWSFLDGDEPDDEPAWRRAGGSGGLMLLAALAAGVVVEGVRRADVVVDLAKDSTGSLSPAMRERLAHVSGTVEIVAVFRDGSPTQQAMRRRLAAYDAVGPQVAVSWVDPLSEPLAAEQLGVTRESGELILRHQGRTQRLVGRLDAGALEDGLTRLLAPRPRRLCWPRTHGEADPDDLRAPEGFGEAVLALEGRGARRAR